MAESKSEFPERIQTKILAYTAILNSRFPSSTTYYMISTGYLDPGEALIDTTPLTIIYTSNNSEPVVESIIYIDQTKRDIFNGNGQYYHLFDSSGVSLTKAIQINKIGVVLNFFPKEKI